MPKLPSGGKIKILAKIIGMDGEPVNTGDISRDNVVSTEYAAGMAGDVINKFDELGLDERFRGIAGEHISRLQLMVGGNVQSSSLHVEKIFPNNERKGVWQRQARISVPQLTRYQDLIFERTAKGTRLRDVADESMGQVVMIGGSEADHDQRAKVLARSLALDWIFYELCGDALASSVYMQQRYGRYIKDFNGQHPDYRAELAISRHFLQAGTGNKSQTVVDDHLAFRAGLGLELLADNLMRKGIVDTHEQAVGATKKLRTHYPKPAIAQGFITPMNYEGIVDRISALEPRNALPSASLGVAQVISIENIE